MAKSRDFSFWRASARDSQHKCSVRIARALLAPPRLSVFSSGRSSLCVLRMLSQQLQLSGWPHKHLWPSSLQVSMPMSKDVLKLHVLCSARNILPAFSVWHSTFYQCVVTGTSRMRHGIWCESCFLAGWQA